MVVLSPNRIKENSMDEKPRSPKDPEDLRRLKYHKDEPEQKNRPPAASAKIELDEDDLLKIIEEAFREN